MKINKEKLKKLTYVTLFCVACIIISRLICFGIYCRKTENSTIKGYIEAFNKWDSGWYTSIVQDGYQDEPTNHENQDAANWAFFPLMPMVLRCISNILHKTPEILGPLMNTVVFTIALIVAWHYLEETRNKKVACIFVLLMTMGMYSFYFSSIYTEAFYLLLIAGFFYAMKKEKYILMGIVGALASATRNTGIMLVFAIIPYIIVKYIKQKGEDRFSVKELFFYIIKQPKFVLGVCLIPLGLFIFMLYLYFKTGDGLAFVHIQRAWGTGDGNIWDVVYQALKNIQGAGFYHAIWAIWGFISVYHLLKNKRYDEATITLILIAIPLSVKMQSFPRYLIGSFFPVVSMCDMLENKNKIELGAFLIMAMIMEYILYSDWIAGASYLT